MMCFYPANLGLPVPFSSSIEARDRRTDIALRFIMPMEVGHHISRPTRKCFFSLDSCACSMVEASEVPV